MLHESDGTTRRRRETGDPRAAAPDTPARLVTFTITAATRSGRTKTTVMRVLTTLRHEAYPAWKSPSCMPRDGKSKSRSFI